MESKMELPATGERYLPSMRGGIRYEHLHRYALSLNFVGGKDVLDLASGEGYGCEILSKNAKSIIGVDIDNECVEYASRKYSNIPNLEFLMGACEAVPLPSESVDVVTSFETIEHHNKHEEMLREIKRILRPGGMLIISAPNRLTYSDKPKSISSNPNNPYHVKEPYDYEVISLLNRHFKNVKVYGQRLATGSFVFPLKNPEQSGLNCYTCDSSNSIAQKVPALDEPIYFIAVCSDEPITTDTNVYSIFIDSDDDLLMVLESQQIQALEEVAQIKAQLHQTEILLAQSQSQLHQMEEVLEQSKSQLQYTEAEFAESQTQLHKTNAMLSLYLSQLHQTEVVLTQSQSQLHQTEQLLEESQSQLHETQIVLEEFQSQLHKTQIVLEESQSQLHQTEEILEESQSQLHETQAELERSRVQETLAPQTNGQTQMQYQLLVWDAWYAYRQGNLIGMAACLQQSLKCTHLSRTETLVNWLESFVRFSAEKGEQLDTYSLTNSFEWKQVTRSATAIKTVVFAQ